MTKSAKGSDGRSLPQALVLSLVLMAAGVFVGAQSDFRSILAHSPGTVAETSWADAFIRVLVNNAPAAALLYTGALTAGIATIIVWPIVSAYVGATFRASAGILGLDEVVGTIWPYAPLEFLALLLAASAGLMPLVSALRCAFAGSNAGVLRAYAFEIPPSLRVIGASFILLVLAAAAEATVIAF